MDLYTRALRPPPPPTTGGTPFPPGGELFRRIEEALETSFLCNLHPRLSQGQQSEEYLSHSYA